MITFIGLFTSPFFNFVFKNFNILIINRLRYSYRNKLKFIYVKEFKNIFDDFDDLKCWLNKKKNKKWIMYNSNSKTIKAFNFNDIENNDNYIYFIANELYLDHIYSF